jgi:CPA1 family monovalent cation:H+ antiporter
MVGGFGAATPDEHEVERSKKASAIHDFWHAADEILNGLLFLLLGLQIFVVPFEPREVGVWAVAIVLVIVARLAVVLPWGAYFHFQQRERGASLLLTWGGLRGAISLALALSLPEGAPRSLVLASTFAVVIFSVVIQGLTFGRLARGVRLKTIAPPDR